MGKKEKMDPGSLKFLKNYQKLSFRGNNTPSERADIKRKCLTHNFGSTTLNEQSSLFPMEKNRNEYCDILDDDPTKSTFMHTDRFKKVFAECDIQTPVPSKSNIANIDLKSMLEPLPCFTCSNSEKVSDGEFHYSMEALCKPKREVPLIKQRKIAKSFAPQTCDGEIKVVQRSHSKELPKSNPFRTARDELQNQNSKKVANTQKRKLGIRRNVNSKFVIFSGNKTLSKRADIKRKCLTPMHNFGSTTLNEQSSFFLFEKNLHEYCDIFEDDPTKSTFMHTDRFNIQTPVPLKSNIANIDLKSMMKPLPFFSPNSFSSNSEKVSDGDFHFSMEAFCKPKREAPLIKQRKIAKSFAPQTCNGEIKVVQRSHLEELPKSNHFRTARDELQNQNLEKVANTQKRKLGIRRNVNSKFVIFGGNKTRSERADIKRKCLTPMHNFGSTTLNEQSSFFLFEKNLHEYCDIFDDDPTKSTFMQTDRFKKMFVECDFQTPVPLKSNIANIDLKSIMKPLPCFSPNIFSFFNSEKDSDGDFHYLMEAPCKPKREAPLIKQRKMMDEEVDERLKNIDPKMVELIKSEIMDVGTTVEWNDIAGLEFAKNAIQEAVVWPMLRPDIFTGLRRPPKGILLFGPPGTGKTLIGKCVASQSKSTFFSISASSLTSKWVGEGEKMVRALFAVARCHQPAVIFIDEIDSLLCQRSESEHESSRRIKTEFLVQLDGATTDNEERIMLIGATNRPQELDEAARRRFVKRLYIPLPEFEARLQLVTRLILNEKHCLTDVDFEKIAQLSEGYSGADIRNLCSEASLGPIRSIDMNMIEKIRADEVRPLVMDDFQKAFTRVRSSVALKDLEQYFVWDKTYGSGL